MFCTSCGKTLDSSARFCSGCGSGVAGSVVTSPHTPTAQPVVYREIRNPGIALLLAIIFPGAGQLYNGQIGKGIIVLLTCWLIIPYLWGLFDAYSTANRLNQATVLALQPR